MPSIAFEEVSKSYGNRLALPSCSLQIDHGEAACLKGPTGSGKTTALRILAGLEKPDAGTVRIGDEVVTSAAIFVPAANRNISMVFQDQALWNHLSVWKHLDLVLKSSGVDKTNRETQIESMIESCALTGIEKAKARTLSGGQRQQLSIARALVINAPILLLDEPFTGLDADLQGRFAALFRKCLSESVTIVMTTHRDRDAGRIGARQIPLSAAQ